MSSRLAGHSLTVHRFPTEVKVVLRTRLKLLAIGFAALLALAGALWPTEATASGVGPSTHVTNVASSPHPLPMPGARPEPQSATPAGPTS